MSTDLGLATVLGAEAIGQPGQRRFRVFAQASTRTALLWMEKEQLNDLAIALDRVLAQITEGGVLRTVAQAGPGPRPSGLPEDFPTRPTFEFQVGQIRIGYDEGRDLLALIAAPIEILLERGQEPRAIIREDEAISIFAGEQRPPGVSAVSYAAGWWPTRLCEAERASRGGAGVRGG